MIRKPFHPLLYCALASLLAMSGATVTCHGYDGVIHDQYESEASPEPESIDALEINIIDDGLVADRAGAEPQRIDLLPGEDVRSKGTYGQVGGAVTSERVMAISSKVFTWYDLTLTPNETSAEFSLSPNLVLFVTEERMIIFDAALNQFIIFDIPMGERVVNRGVSLDAAVFVTFERAVGYSAGSAEFSEMPFSAGELFRDLDISTDLISVETSNRVLLYQGTPAEWME